MSDTAEINFAPDVQGTIEATRSRRLDWPDILGEMIDNAFDAAATSVQIDIDGKSITVTDNGSGCGDFEAMLTMGKHTRQATTQLGRYGVGLKDSAWWVGGATRITSTSKGVVRNLFVDWDKLQRWSLPAPTVADAEGEHGTKIRFDRIARRFPDGKAFADLVEKVGFIYSPALKNGRQIGFRRGRGAISLATRYVLPDLEDVIDRVVDVEGKKVRVHVGIVPEGKPNPRPGLNYTHGFRVIIPATALGCGGNGCSRIAGWVSLDEGWRLTRNKDDISTHKDELGDAVYGAIKDVVLKASRQAMAMQSTSLASSLTDAFRGLASLGVGHDGEKGKRDPARNDTGRINPANTNRKHRRFTKTQAAESAARRIGKFRIDFQACNDGAIGNVDLDGGVIWLADNHPRIIEARAEENETALLFAAVMLFAVRDSDSGTSLLSFVRDGSVSRKIECVAGRLLAEDTREAKAPPRLAVAK